MELDLIERDRREEPLDVEGGVQACDVLIGGRSIGDDIRYAPGSGGAVANALVKILTTKRDMPMNPQYSVLDRQELDDLILNS